MSPSKVTTQTMSNKEISDLTGKQLSHVNRDIAKMMAEILDLDDPKMDDLDFKGFYCSLDSRGYVSSITLDYDLTTCLLTGYDAKARMAVVKRWQELESKVISLPTDFESALEHLLAQVKENTALGKKILADSSKVAFVEDYVEHGSSKCFRDVAALLGVKQNRFMSILMDRGIIHKKSTGPRPKDYEYKAYAKYSHLFETKSGLNQYAGENGTEYKEYIQLRVNNAGVVYLADRFGAKEAAQPPIVRPMLVEVGV